MTASISNEIQLRFSSNKTNVKPRVEAWVTFALSGETIDRTNWFDIFISLEIQIEKKLWRPSEKS